MEDAVPDDVGDVHADALSHEGVAAAGVDDFALLVHDVIVFEEALADTEVVLFHFLLGALDGAVDHLVLNHFSFFESEAVHDFGYAVAGEETHEFVFEGYVEDG